MKRYVKIYHKKSHVLITFVVILLPFLFLLALSPLGNFHGMEFLADLVTSAMRLFIAYAVSVVLAVILGITLSRGKVGDFFLPVFDVLQSFPTFALLPIAVSLFGPGAVTVILFLVLTVIWPILFAIISALKLVHPAWEDAALVFGATGWKRLWYFALPVSYPGIITGSIVGLGDGWEAMIGAEIIVGLRGHSLGGFFNASGGSGNYTLLGVMAFLLFIFAINKLFFLPLLDRSHKLLTE